MKSLSRYVLFLCMAGLLSGCFMKRASVPVQFYVLASPAEVVETVSVPSGMKPGTMGPRIGIMPVLLPAYLQRPQMVLRDANSVDIQMEDYNRWGEDLDLGIVRVLSISLGNNLRDIRGTAMPLRTGSQVDYRLQVEVRRFEGQPGGLSQLEAVWSIRRDSEPVREGHFQSRSHSGDHISTMVQAQSALLDELGYAIAQGMREEWLRR